MVAPVTSGPSSLFDHLPERIFSPLASANRLQYWRLMRHLYRRRFGDEAPPIPSEGFTRNELARDVQDFLAAGGDWEDEEGDEPATPIDIRAQMILTRLIESGWLRVDRYGIDKRLSMDHKVSSFLTLLVEFAEAGPVFLGGKIRSIEANVQGALNQGHGDQLNEAASQVRKLLDHVRNTGTNVRDVMERLTPELTTREFIRRFFTEFVSRIFIGDYRELRTTEHPLARRSDILEAVERIHDTPALRARVIAWYRDQRCAGDAAQAEALLRRDFDRLRDLYRIDEYLQRLDREVTRANKRALAFMDYRMRAARPLDALIERAIAATLTAGDEMRAPLPSGPMVGEMLLRMPKARKERPPASSLRKSVPTDEQIARARLMRRIQDARDVGPMKLAAHAHALCGEDREVASADITPLTTFELFAYQRMLDLALANSIGSPRLRQLARLDMLGFDVEWSDEARADPETAVLGSPAFVLRRRTSNTGAL